MATRRGAGASTLHERSVFINCPFDNNYGPSLDAIIFTATCCGFEPRSALETDKTSDSRLKRIVDALRSSSLSIHDLSLVYGDAETGVARLNMPLELGIAMAMKLAHENRESERPHDWTALVLSGSAYVRAVSDLNGHDLKRYEGRDLLVAQVMAWLVTRMKNGRTTFTPKDVLKALPEFDERLKDLREAWSGLPVWSDIIATGKSVAQSNGLTVGDSQSTSTRE